MSATSPDQPDIDAGGSYGYVPADANVYIPARRRAAALWGTPPDVTVVAPGRIEIVGNHLDYNGGNVIAAAIDRWVAVVAQHRSDGLLHATAPDATRETGAEPVEVASRFDRRAAPVEPDWFDFPRAAIAACEAAGIHCPGVAFYYRGTIPLGLGLASSSALLVAIVIAIAKLADASVQRYEIATIAREAEHRLGAPVGLLDQVSSVAGGMLRFSNRRAEIRRLAPRLGDAVFVVADSGIRHALPGSRYTVRVAECREALAVLQEAGFAIDNLAALAPADLDAAAALLPEPLDRRLRHVVEEVERVKHAEAAIEAGDVAEVGRLMDASGRSSAGLYEISHPVVEGIVAAAREVPGVYGARMMGGGDGGAAIVLVERDAVPALERALGDGALTVCRVARGATIVS